MKRTTNFHSIIFSPYRKVYPPCFLRKQSRGTAKIACLPNRQAWKLSLKAIFLGSFLIFLFFQGNLSHAQTPTPLAREYFTFHNLVRNGSFESFDQTEGLPAQWGITDSSQVSLLSDPLAVKVGAVTVKLSGPVTLTQDIRDWKGLEASNVTLGAWIKGSSGDSLKFYVDDGVNRQEKAVSLTDTQWKFVTFKPASAINASASFLKVEVEVVSTATGISLDGVMLSQVTKGVAFVPNPDDQEKSPQDLIYTDGVNGLVGIGTSTPQKELDVAGDIRASGKVYQGESEQQEEVLTKTAADDLYLNDDQDETLSGNLTVSGTVTSLVTPLLDQVTADSKYLSLSGGEVSGGLSILGNVGIGKERSAFTLDVAGDAQFQRVGGVPFIVSTPDSDVRLFSTANVPIYLGTAGNAGMLSIHPSGNVGIGTTEPGMRLESKTTVDGIATTGSTAIGGFRIRGTKFYNTVLDMGIGAGDAGNNTWLQATDAGDLSQKYVLSLNPNGGNVGIGTTSPLAKLHAGDTVTDYSGMIFTNTGAVISSVGADHEQARSNVFTLMRDGVSGVRYSGAVRFDMSKWASDDVNARTQLDVRLADTDTNTLTDVLSLRSNGNVGIGTTEPNAKLDVSGDIRLTGNIIPDGDICIGRCN